MEGLLILYLILHVVGGHFGMLLILGTILSSQQVVRHACFVNFCCTWLLFSVSYSLLFYAGQLENPNPPHLLCLFQAAMSYGSAPMTGVSSFIFILHILLVLRNVTRGTPSSPRRPKLRLFVMLISPYLVYLAVIFTVIIYGHNNPQQIDRSTFNCHVNARAIAIIPPAISVVVVLASITLEVAIAITLYRNWSAFRKDNGQTSGLSLQLLIRALLFTLCAITALLVCVAFIANMQSPAPAIVTACLPMCAFILFGTQPDLLRAWRLGLAGEKRPHAFKSIGSKENGL